MTVYRAEPPASHTPRPENATGAMARSNSISAYSALTVQAFQAETVGGASAGAFRYQCADETVPAGRIDPLASKVLRLRDTSEWWRRAPERLLQGQLHERRFRACGNEWLLHGEQLLLEQRQDAEIREAANRLGWSSRTWSSPDRARIREELVTAGIGAVGPVLDAVQTCGRSEVVDEAVEVLCALVSEAGAEQAISHALAERSVGTEARIAIGRAVGKARVHLPWHVGTLSTMLRDGEPDVRESAAWACVRLGTSEAVSALKAAIEVENDPTVLETMKEALDEIDNP